MKEYTKMTDCNNRKKDPVCLKTLHTPQNHLKPERMNDTQ